MPYIFCVRRVCRNVNHNPPVGIDGAVHGHPRLVQGAVGDCQVLSHMAVAFVPPFWCTMGWGVPCNARRPIQTYAVVTCQPGHDK